MMANFRTREDRQRMTRKGLPYGQQSGQQAFSNSGRTGTIIQLFGFIVDPVSGSFIFDPEPGVRIVDPK